MGPWSPWFTCSLAPKKAIPHVEILLMGTMVKAAAETWWLLGCDTHTHTHMYSPWLDPCGGSWTLSRSLWCPLYVASLLSFASEEERGLLESWSLCLKNECPQGWG